MKSFTICTIGLLHGMAAFIGSAQAECGTIPGVAIQFTGLGKSDVARTTYVCSSDHDVNNPDKISDQGGKPGGDGSPDDPLDFGGSTHCFTPCEIIYIPYLNKFARFTSSQCQDCDNLCQKNEKLEIVVWLGSNDESIGPDVKAAQTQCMHRFTSDRLQPIVRGGFETIEKFSVQPIPLFDSDGCHHNTYPPPGKDLCSFPQAGLPSLDGSFISSATTNPALSQGNGVAENAEVNPKSSPQVLDSLTAPFIENDFQLLTAPNPDSAFPALKSSFLSPPMNLGTDNTPPKKVASAFYNPDDGTAEGGFTQDGSFGTFPVGSFGRRRRRAVKV